MDQRGARGQTSNTQLAFRPGQHRLVARRTGAAPGALPQVTWARYTEIDPRVRGFKLQFNEADSWRRSWMRPTAVTRPAGSTRRV